MKNMRYKFEVTWGAGFSQKFHTSGEMLKALKDLIRSNQTVTIKNIYKI